MTFLSSPAASTIGIVLSRVIVPLWVLTGAAFKLIEKTPKLLPPSIWEPANDAGINLFWLLAVIIGLELLAVGVMLFLARLARAMALFMVGCFCLILIAEIVAGSESCGCLGKYSFSPWIMLAIDATLLLAVIVFRPRYGEMKLLPRLSLGATAAWTGAGAALCVALILPTKAPPGPTPPANGLGGPTGSTGTPADRVADRLPDAGYYVPECDSWVGKAWGEIPLARYMPEWPKDVEVGRRYVIFYGRTCDHCETMFDQYFRGALPVPTTVVAIPETADGFETDGVLPMRCTQCTTFDLPVGCDWIITTPIVVALEDGVVKCAIEGEDPEDPQCLIWHE